MMLARTSIITAASLLAACASMGTSANPAHGQGSFEFALIGDVPYAALPGVADAKYDVLVHDINSTKKIRWVMHAGDIKSGSTMCSDELFSDRLQRLNQFDIPVIYTPGDNEWTDCHRINNGQYQPLERLDKIRQIFFAKPGVTIGGNTLRVDTQAAVPGFDEFPENVRWSHQNVLFATLHIVGSNNAQAPFQSGSTAVRSQAGDNEVTRRNAANIAWLDSTFAKAKAENSPGVMLMIQANPGLEFTDSVNRVGFEHFLLALENHVKAFGKPVVLTHGDPHYFRVDKPKLVNNNFLPNFTRVETFGAANVHWIKVTVDPNSSDVFRFEPAIVESLP